MSLEATERIILVHTPQGEKRMVEHAFENVYVAYTDGNWVKKRLADFKIGEVLYNNNHTRYGITADYFDAEKGYEAWMSE